MILGKYHTKDPSLLDLTFHKALILYLDTLSFQLLLQGMLLHSTRSKSPLKTDMLVDMCLPPVALAMASLIQHYLESKGNPGESTNPSIFITSCYLALPIPELA